MSFIFKGETKEEVEMKATEIRESIETNGKFDYLLDVRQIVTNTGTYWKATMQIYFKEYRWEH